MVGGIASSEHRPLRLPRRRTASRRERSEADAKPHQALAAYVSLAIMTARYTIWSDGSESHLIGQMYEIKNMECFNRTGVNSSQRYECSQLGENGSNWSTDVKLIALISKQDSAYN